MKFVGTEVCAWGGNNTVLITGLTYRLGICVAPIKPPDNPSMIFLLFVVLPLKFICCTQEITRELYLTCFGG